MYRIGGGGLVAGGGLAYTGTPVLAYALLGVVLIVLGVLAYRYSSVTTDGR